MIREELIPKRDKKTETALKKIILEIEDVLYDESKKVFIENKIEEANQLIMSKNRKVDIYMIEYYYSWTSLDGFIGSLTLQVPPKIELSEEEIVELILYIQENVVKNVMKTTNEEDWEYKFNFYHEYFVNYYSRELFGELFNEDVNVTELAKKMINFQKSVILL